MHKPLLIALSLTCALALSGCKTSGAAVRPECPRPSPVPASLMQAPTTEQRVSAEFFEPQPSATPRSVGSKPW